MQEPKTLADVIALWPSMAEFANAIQIKPDLARHWKQRDAIPVRYWGDVVTADEVVKLPVTMGPLTRLDAKLFPEDFELRHQYIRALGGLRIRNRSHQETGLLSPPSYCSRQLTDRSWDHRIYSGVQPTPGEPSNCKRRKTDNNCSAL
jgi:hypothetical protein